MSNIIKEITVFYNECKEFVNELNIIIKYDEIIVINIKKILNTKTLDPIIDFIKLNNKTDIINFLQLTKNINIITNILHLFMKHASVDIYKYRDITDSSKFDFNSKLINLRKSHNLFKKQINTDLKNLLNEYYDSITSLNDDTIQQINDLYNDSFIIFNNDIIVTPSYKLFNMINGIPKDMDVNTSKISNMIIDDVVIIYNKFIDTNDVINKLIELNKNNILTLTNSQPLLDKYITNDHSGVFKVNKNNFQLYEFIPFLLKDNKNIIAFSDIIYKLTQYRLPNYEFNELLKAAQSISTTKYMNFVFMIIQNSGNNVNYNINPLFDNNVVISRTAGVNQDMVYKFNTIEQLDNSSTTTDYVHVINYSNDKPNVGILLETTDFKKFRLMININVINNINKTIGANLNDSIFIKDDVITKILKQQTSDRIANYNKIVENSIIANIQDNSLSQFYTSIDSNFNIYTNDAIYNKFTANIIDAIVKNVVIILKNKNIKKNDPIKFNILPILLDASNIKIFTNSIIEFYNTMKLTHSESFLTYLSLLEYTINKFKKEIIDGHNAAKYSDYNSVFDILYNLIINSVKNVINVKTHIYDMSIEKEQLLIAFKHKLDE